MSELTIDVVRGPESQVFERKRSLSLADAGLESLCGMLNAEPAQGAVAFGIEPDGQIIGVEPGDLDKAQRSLSQKITNKFQPPIQCRIEVLETEGKAVVTISAQRNRTVAYHEFDGRAFVREGTATRQLSFGEKESLQRQRNRDSHTGPWKCDRCGSWVGTLLKTVLTDRGPRKSYGCECGGEFWPAS